MIWFLGDVHGRFDHVIRLVKLHRPEAVVFLGDLECSLPLDMILRPILEQTEIWFIHGNHDSDRPAYWHNLHGCGLADRSLHGRVVEIAGHRIAGLGGTFELPVWLPGSRDTGIQNYGDFLKHLALRPQHADILATKRQHAQSAIYPDDYFTLAMEKADILVCHEAPSCHPYGYTEIDDLTLAIGARMVVHGHHHDSLDYRQAWPKLGFEAHGVAFRSIMAIDGSIIT
ncbi:metallophosphoesterase family protein [Pseudomonas rhodesiae]|uniref:metallophosphoesterase family protein n=1 Tax=Pseudomonas rhodesiae TaxID=76760 RepID=UPI002736F3D1|nr:metallophosphoesterase [Pseudomonas rhodesiae]EKT4482670.1 metallophosphoesterase family protein [Pseudomonas putida]MDE1529255.1 metallophosphoesterase [Pseudomonas carnis]WLG42019.1 metallophosphoesterase [Pseudomonas rhodesiae]